MNTRILTIALGLISAAALGAGASYAQAPQLLRPPRPPPRPRRRRKTPRRASMRKNTKAMRNMARRIMRRKKAAKPVRLAKPSKI